MSFMEGFAAGFVPAYRDAANAEKEKEQEASKLALTRWLSAKETYDEEAREDAQRVTNAKAIVAEMPGVPEDAWRNVYSWMVQGRTVEKIREDLQTGSFQPRSARTGPGTTPAVSTSQAPTVDGQMATSGLGEADGSVQTFSINRPNVAGAEIAPAPSPTPSQGVETAPVASETPSRASGETGPAQPDPLFAGIDESYINIARNTLLSAAGSEDVLRQVMSGYRSTAGDPTMTFMPAPSSRSTKLTQADVAGRYSTMKLAAINGEAGAVEAYNTFVQRELPVLIEALSITDNNTQTTDLVRAYDNLTAAQRNGTPEQVAQAQSRVDQLLFIEGQRNNARTSGQQRQLVMVGENGPTFSQGFIQPTAQGNRVVDTTGQPLQGTWREVTEQERKDGDEAIKTINTRITAHTQNLVNTTGALRLTGELVGISRENPQVLTSVAGMVRSAQGLLREANTFTSVMNSIIQDNNGEPVTREQFERELQRTGALPDGLTLEQAASVDFKDLTLGPTAENLANLRSLFEAKIFLMAFRAGGLEGQSGNAMSNKDFERLLQIVNASANAQTFEQNLADYVRGRVNALVDNERLIMGDDSGLIGRFRQQYGYSPVENVVKPLDRFIEERNDPALRTAYDMVMGRGQNAMPTTGAAPNARPTPTEGAATAPAQTQPQQISGHTFRGFSDDGRPVYQKDGTEELFVLE